MAATKVEDAAGRALTAVSFQLTTSVLFLNNFSAFRGEVTDKDSIRKLTMEQARRIAHSRPRWTTLRYLTECGFRFPVPIAEAGTATFLAEDRAILFMRYIRKYMTVMEDSKH
jgi:hypothetical protein